MPIELVECGRETVGPDVIPSENWLFLRWTIHEKLVEDSGHLYYKQNRIPTPRQRIAIPNMIIGQKKLDNP